MCTCFAKEDASCNDVLLCRVHILYTKLCSSPELTLYQSAHARPSFEPGQLDKLSSWALSTKSNRPIVAEYEPDGFWLWTQWTGTILEMTYKNVLIALVWSVLVDLYCYQHYTVYLIATAAVNGGDVGQLLEGLSWVSFEIPHSKDPIIDTLTALNSLWEYQLNLAIFTLSFFVNHAYGTWKNGKRGAATRSSRLAESAFSRD